MKFSYLCNLNPPPFVQPKFFYFLLKLNVLLVQLKFFYLHKLNFLSIQSELLICVSFLFTVFKFDNDIRNYCNIVPRHRSNHNHPSLSEVTL